ncbi:MAG TPA: ATP-binding protein [Pyrinomonadaceae bacterium]|nr:ATP-binding protein [Pyrinomonadaceae bacterium]
MSSRLKLVPALICASCAGLFAYLLWSPGASLTILLSLLVGIALGWVFYGKTGEKSTVSFQAQDENREDATDQAPANVLLMAMMDGVREGVLVVDCEMQVVASNNAARLIFNRQEERLEGVRLSSLTRNPTVHSAFSSALESGLSTEVKVELLSQGRTFDMRVVPLNLNGEGARRGAIGVFFDVTRLERLEHVRQEFLTNVSHELRTPLTSILAFVETLEEGAINDPANSSRFLSVIRKNAVRMHQLLNDILELSSIEAGQVQLQIEQVRLRHLVDDITGALSVKARSRGIHLYNEIGADVTVESDPRRLEQMLTNLVENAIKFNRDGGSVRISFERGERDCISVHDTGQGIPAEAVERIFERFYRADRSRSPEKEGTGLGLAIVKHLARAHSGEVSVKSTPNEGSTFTIELPAMKRAVAGIA